MKRIALFICALLLAGCSAQYPITTALRLQVDRQSTAMYDPDTTAALKGHDARQETAVVIYRLKGKSEVQIPNETPPHALVTNQLAAGLQAQGLVFAGGSPVRIQLDLNELVATVTRPKLLYSATARSYVTLTIKNRKISLSKTFDRETTRDTATKPPVHELEKMLNDQLTDIVNQILQDPEIRAAISQR
jgi:uncharacterized lipoprotein